MPFLFILQWRHRCDGQNWTGQEVKKSETYIDIYKDIKPLSLEAKRQSSPPLEPKWKIEDLEG